MDNSKKQKQSDDFLTDGFLKRKIIDEELIREPHLMEEKEFYIFVFSMIAGIAFLDTSGPIWTLEFLREFLYKVIIFSIVGMFVGAGGLSAVNTISQWFQKKK